MQLCCLFFACLQLFEFIVSCACVCGILPARRKRYFEIYGCCLHYYTDEGKSDLKGTVPMLGCRMSTSIKAEDDKFGFQIELPTRGARVYLLCADTVRFPFQSQPLCECVCFCVSVANH
jgi:hypothetical protein